MNISLLVSRCGCSVFGVGFRFIVQLDTEALWVTHTGQTNGAGVLFGGVARDGAGRRFVQVEQGSGVEFVRARVEQPACEEGLQLGEIPAWASPGGPC